MHCEKRKTAWCEIETLHGAAVYAEAATVIEYGQDVQILCNRDSFQRRGRELLAILALKILCRCLQQ